MPSVKTDRMMRLLRNGLTATEKRELRHRQEAEMHDALLAWVKMQSGENAHRLYNAGIAYFGIAPVVHD